MSLKFLCLESRIELFDPNLMISVSVIFRKLTFREMFAIKVS